MSCNSMPQSSTVSGRPANAGGFFRNASVENLTLTRFPDTSTGRREGSLAIINPHIKEGTFLEEAYPTIDLKY